MRLVLMLYRARYLEVSEYSFARPHAAVATRRVLASLFKDQRHYAPTGDATRLAESRSPILWPSVSHTSVVLLMTPSRSCAEIAFALLLLQASLVSFRENVIIKM